MSVFYPLIFKNWIISSGLAVTSAKKYESAVYGSISNWAKAAGLINSNLIQIDKPEELFAISEFIKELTIFKERNTVGNQMYSAALNKYAEYLKISQNEIEEDILMLNANLLVSETEKENLIKSRLGQGVFRNSLLDYWKGCAVTGYNSSKLLIASHIKPWRSSDNIERLDPFNGLLLIPNLDKAFDKGFISFKKSGEVIISQLLERPSLLGIDSELRIRLSDSHNSYLEYHRDMVLLNVN